MKYVKIILMILSAVLLSVACVKNGEPIETDAAPESVTETESQPESESTAETEPVETTPIIEKAEGDVRVTSNLTGVRDPFVLNWQGTYYLYATGWRMSVNESGDLENGWSELRTDVVEVPEDCIGDQWAPEVHEYNGSLYMFTTYKSSKNDHRGCAIFKSDTPEGPFTLWSDGTITPDDWDAIDGTLYVDPDGQPWMIFVHEWVSTDDGIGRFAAAKLSDDLKTFVSEPIELFRADDAEWSRNPVTDGCFMYRTAEGRLLMLWSSWDSYGYSVWIAKKSTGTVEGQWKHETQAIYSKSMFGDYDGGHASLFRDNEGRLYASMHSPNAAADDGTRETAVFIPLKEERSTLKWDLEPRN